MVNSVFLELGHFTAILNKTLIGTQPVRHNEKPGLGTQMLREYFSKEANLRGARGACRPTAMAMAISYNWFFLWDNKQSINGVIRC